MSTFKKRLAGIAVLATSGLLLLPAAGQAAQVFGDGFVHEPEQMLCEMTFPCSVAAFVEIPGEGQFTRAGSPIDGVITKFRIEAKVGKEPDQVTFRVVNVHPTSPFNPANADGPETATASATGSGPTVTLTSTEKEEEALGRVPIREFASRVPVKKGQHLGIDSSKPLEASYAPGGDMKSFEFLTPLGAAERQSDAPKGELLVQATVEPDVDGDGFGDETQDHCPSQKTTQGPCDLTKPAVSGFRVLLRKGKASYTLSEASTVSLQLLRKKPHSHRFKPFGKAFAGPGAAGANSVVLPRKSQVKPGVYRLTLTATDAVGNVGSATTRFRLALRSILNF
jgi:hypothetical protein